MSELITTIIISFTPWANHHPASLNEAVEYNENIEPYDETFQM